MYSNMSKEQKAKHVQNKYDSKDGLDIYATSRDFNLRELEIDFIIESIQCFNKQHTPIPRILDVGCGNGYTDIRIAEQIRADTLGIDFSQTMIDGAKKLAKNISRPSFLMFTQDDAQKATLLSNYFDIAISERYLLNLPSKEAQHTAIKEIRRVLKPQGIYIMVEGSRDGLRKLNNIRESVGLEPIPDADEDNASSLKFEEDEIELYLSKYFTILHKQHFGMYYLISRVVHPLLVMPDEPKFDAKINKVARQMASITRDYEGIGHIVGYVLRKK